MNTRTFLRYIGPPFMFVVGLLLMLIAAHTTRWLLVPGGLCLLMCFWLLPSPVDSITKGWMNLEPSRYIPRVGTVLGDATLKGNVLTGTIQVVPDGWTVDYEEFDGDVGVNDDHRWTIALVREQDHMLVAGVGPTKATARAHAIAEANRLDGN